MKLKSHQVKASKQLTKKLAAYKIALLLGEPRSGKTLSFIDAVRGYKSPLIITQKNAIGDIKKQAAAVGVDVYVTNYHQAIKLRGFDFDIVVFDEAHRWIAGYPKPSSIWKSLKPIARAKPIIFSSGTITPQSYSSLYHILGISSFSPWSEYKNFYRWFDDYGRPYSINIGQHTISQYDRTNERRVMRSVKHLVVSITREEAGHKHEAVDEIVNIKLSKKQQKLSEQLKEDRVIPKLDILADTPVKLIQKLHQISGGFVKTEDDSIYSFRKNPKLKWLKKNIDPENTVILAHYKAEQEMLAEEFPHTGSITKLAEGVDFSMFDSMVIYSMSFSAATYEQVRARQMNINRATPITIKYLVAGIDKYVYDAVKAKKNFTARWYSNEA